METTFQFAFFSSFYDFFEPRPQRSFSSLEGDASRSPFPSPPFMQPRSQGLSSSRPIERERERPWYGLVTCIPKSGT